MRKFPYRLLLAVVALGASTAAMAVQWHMLPEQSRLEYVATYEGQQAPGEFHEFQTDLQFDPQAPESGRLEVTVNLASVDMYSSDVNEAIRQQEWLDVEEVGPAKFISDRITALGNGRFVAKGTLRLKGVTKPLEVPFTWRTHGGTTSMDGALTVDRTRFDIGTGEWASPTPIGVEVELKFHVLLKPGV